MSKQPGFTLNFYKDLVFGHLHELLYWQPVSGAPQILNPQTPVAQKIKDVLGHSVAGLLQDLSLWQKLTHKADAAWINDINAYKTRLATAVPSDNSNHYYLEHKVCLRSDHDQRQIWIAHRFIPYFAEQELQGFLGIIRDISSQKQTEAKLAHTALHDELTGLANRTLFINNLENAILRAVRQKDYRFAVLFLDIDRFKSINDVMGHPAGDQILTILAERFTSFLRPSDTIARFGGDEFAILLQDIRYIYDTIYVAERIQDLLAQPMQIQGRELIISASIGIVMHTERYKTAVAMLADADTAMYRAKISGRARYELFDSNMRSQIIDDLQLESDLRHALNKQQLVLNYQPIVDLKDGRLLAFEALLCWEHPQQGLLPARKFNRIAEETGLIVPIGYWVVQTVCQQLYDWQQVFGDNVLNHIAINLSARQLLETDLVEQISAVLEQTGLAANYLQLELNEAAIMQGGQASSATLLRLRQLGLQLTLDDFGTGYSALSHLHQLPFNNLKISADFMQGLIQHEAKSTAIVESIIALAHKLDLQIIAQDIDSTDVYQQLLALQCDAGQGKLFAAPLDVEQATELLTSDKAILYQPAIPAKTVNPNRISRLD